MWADEGKQYEISRRTELIDLQLYSGRVKLEFNNWKWPGETNGNNKLPFIEKKEVISKLSVNTKFTVKKILYQAETQKGKVQAVEVTGPGIKQKAFILAYYNNIKYFKEVSEQQDDENEYIIKEISDDELLEGFIVPAQKKVKLIIPTIDIEINLDDETYSKNDKFILRGYLKVSKNQNLYYKSGTIGEYLVQGNDEIPKLKFYGTPQNLLYTFELKPEKPIIDEDGNKIASYKVFEDKSY